MAKEKTPKEEKKSLRERVFMGGSIKEAAILEDSKFFNNRETTQLPIPILNVAFGGDFKQGLPAGLTIFAGLQATFKSLTGLICMKAFMDKNPDAFVFYYDSEFGTTKKYLSGLKIDMSRVVHIPLKNIELLKSDMVQRLENVEREDKVFIFVDSLGLLPSKKEIEDALTNNEAADMTRAKAIRSFFRIITPILTIKDIPCIIINHIYKEIGMYPRTIVSGGTAVMLAANQVFIFSKEKPKTGDGWWYNIKIVKSRFVKQDEFVWFRVSFTGGIQPYSGLLELAIESGDIVKPKNGWYQLIDNETGECIGKMTQGEDNTDNLMPTILGRKSFCEFVEKKYKLSDLEDYKEPEAEQVAQLLLEKVEE